MADKGLWSVFGGRVIRRSGRSTLELDKGKFVLFIDASRAHQFSYHLLLDITCMVTLTYFFRGNPLTPHRLLFPISSKVSFICTFPTYRSLWCISYGPLVGTENCPNCKWVHCAGSIWWLKPSQVDIITVATSCSSWTVVVQNKTGTGDVLIKVIKFCLIVVILCHSNSISVISWKWYDISDE